MPNSDEKVIRFIDSCYNNLFSLPDGGTLVIVRDDGEVVEKPKDRSSRVSIRTGFGALRIMDMLVGEQLPRIC